MKKLKAKIGRFIQQVVDLGVGNGLMQEENMATGEDVITAEMARYIRRCAAEGCVLLKNDGALPLKEETKVAVFGRCQFDWFYVGYGSGGDVHPPYRVNLIEGLANAGVNYDIEVAQSYKNWCNSKEHKADHGWWGHWPMSHPEMPLEKDAVEEAANRCDTAIVVIGRAAGEDRENTLTPGSYYLTDEEKNVLDMVTDAFSKTVVLLNAGNIMDMSWVEDYGNKISALLLVWQGGMESGNAVADVLTGKVNPCGKLTDTIAKSYEDYPSSTNFGGKEFNDYEEGIYVGYRYFQSKAKDKVLYPFGYGLSYTDFAVRETEFIHSDVMCESEYDSLGMEKADKKQDGDYKLRVAVENTGRLPGREVMMLFVKAPQGKLEKTSKVLVSYGKTKVIAPGETDIITLTWDESCMASYDDIGATGYKSAFVLEAGTYKFYLGEPVTYCRDKTESVYGECVGSIHIEQTRCIKQCESVCNKEIDLRERILSRLPKEIPVTGNKGYTLADVVNNRITLDAFVAQLSDEELEALTRGEGGMNSSLGVIGNAGAFGGVIESLRKKGVPPIITADGPAGLRLRKFTALLPCGTALACTWDDVLVEKLFEQVGQEMQKHKLDIVLSPGMNIHRNPLCGRNFEYFSEDPLLTGKMAAAVVRGVQSQGASCCPKHFACNNQEVKRNTNDSRLSERTLREIYLRGFEICVKEGKPNTIMTSYNKINGVWSHYNYDLATTILRKEWGFDGVVVTDWWMQKCSSPEFPKIKDNAYRVRAQVDVLMPGNMRHANRKYTPDGTLLKTLGKSDGITRAELQRSAKNVLKFILKQEKIYN